MPNYPYYGYQPYQPYQPPMADQLMQLRQQQYQPMIQQTPQQPAQNGIIWVQGEEGAKAYMVAPGASVLLMDSENSSFYIKSTDQSGMPMPLRIFDYTERTAQRPVQAQVIPSEEYVTRAEFDALTARLDALTTPAKQTKKTATKEETVNE